MFFLFILISSFGFSDSLKAFQTGAVYPHPNGYANVKFTLNGVNKEENFATGIYKVDGKKRPCYHKF